MIHQTVSIAIGLVYLFAFYTTCKHHGGCCLKERIAQISPEHYCHLALAFLYPLNGMHLG